jgi:hypothetical protein
MVLYGSATRTVLSSVAETKPEITKTKQIWETAEMSALKTKKVDGMNKARHCEKSRLEISTLYLREKRMCEDTKSRREEPCIMTGKRQHS